MRPSESHRSYGQRVIERLAGLVIEHPWRMLLLAFAILIGLAPGAGRVVKNMHYSVWFQKSDPRIQRLDQFEQRFGSDLAAIVYLHSPSGIFDRDSAQLLIELTDRMWKVSETIRVESLSNFAWVRGEGDEIVVEDLIPHDRALTPALLAERRAIALGHEQLPGFLVSRDGKTAVVYAWLRPTKTGAGDNQYNDFLATYRDLTALIAELDGRGDHSFHLGGYPVTEAWMEINPPRAMQRLLPVIAGVCLVLLLAFFRRPSGVLLPFTVVLPSVVATQGFAGWVGISLNQMTINVPNILVVVAVASTDNTLYAYFRALDHGLARREAARHALHETLGSTFFASVAIGLGFLSLLTMTLVPFQQLGLMVGVGSMIVWLFTYLIIGPLLVILPIKRRRGRGAALSEEELVAPDARALRLTGWIDRHRVAIVAAWIALCALSLWLALQNRVTLEQRSWYYADMAESYDFVEQQLGYTEAFEIAIEAGEAEGIKEPGFLRRVDELAGWLRSQDEVVQVTSLVDILKDVNRVLSRGDPAHYRLPDSRAAVADLYFLYTVTLPLGKNLNDRVTLANDALRMTVFSRGRESPVVLRLIEETRARARALGLEVSMTGRALLNNQINPEVVPSFMRSLVTGTFFIAIALLVFFRSLRLGALSLVTNLVPVLIGAGLVLFLIGKPYDMTTIATFVIVLSVSVDDTVHFIESYHRARRRGHDRRESIARVWTSVGPAMLFTTLVLAGSFAFFTVSDFPWARDFGTVMALTLIVNFLADFLLGPALILLGRDRPDR